MNWFSEKKEYKDYYNEGYLLAVFSAGENLEKLQKEYESMRQSSANTQIMKAKMAGFMAGLEVRNKSGIDKLQQALSKKIERDREGHER